MLIAIIQQHASTNDENNLKRGLIAIDKASEQGAKLAVFAELAFTRFFPQKHASGSVSNTRAHHSGFYGESKRTRHGYYNQSF